MAVTLTPPNTYSTLSSAIFTLSNSDTGTDPVQINAGYQVKDGASNNLTVVERMPNTGGTEKYDIAGLLASLVETPFPGEVSGITNLLQYAASYSVSYGTITFDASDCSTVQALTSSTTGLKIVNAYLEPYQSAAEYNSGNLQVLSYKPTTIYAGPGQSDYIYVFRSSGEAWIRATVYYNDGTTTTQTTGRSLNGSAAYISSGPANLFATTTKAFSSYKIEVASSSSYSDSRVFNYKIDTICNDERNATTLFFLNPMGGWESMEFEDHSIGGGRDVVQYRSPVMSDSVSLSQGGILETDIRTSETLSLSRVVDTTEGLGEFVSAMMRGRDYYVRYYKGGQFRLCRAHMGSVNSQPVTAKTTNLQVSVTLNNPS